MAVKHAFTSGKSDGGDATLVRPSNWNADHIVDVNGIPISSRTDGSDPSAPGAGTLIVYAKTVAGRVLPKWIGPSGVDTPFQPFMGMNHVRLIQPGTATAATTVVQAVGIAFTASATTYAQQAAGTGSLKTRTRLSTLTGTTTAGTLTYIRGNNLECARETGFFFVNRFGLHGTIQSGHRAFFGLRSTTSNPTNVDPQAAGTTSSIGMSVNASTGNWFIGCGSGSAASWTDLGASFAQSTTNLLELALFSAPGGSAVYYRATNLTSGANASGSLSTNLPSNTTYLSFLNFITNNATALASAFAFKSLYLETDY